MEQLLMNVVKLFTRDMDDWERKPTNGQTYNNLCPFIQAAYQHHLASGVITATASGYASNNRFAGLAANNKVSDDGTADTIVESINSHMANLSTSVFTQSNTSNNANTAIFNASMQQMAANKAQRNNEHTRMLQQFAMMTTNQPGPQQFASQNRLRVTAEGGVLTIAVLAPTQHWAPAQQWAPPRGGGRGGTRSRNGCGHRTHRGPGTPVPPPPNPRYSNALKQWAKQNVCFSCRFDVEDWHNSSTYTCKKVGHQDGVTRSNYLEYECANHWFSTKVVHKMMYPNM